MAAVAVAALSTVFGGPSPFIVVDVIVEIVVDRGDIALHRNGSRLGAGVGGAT